MARHSRCATLGANVSWCWIMRACSSSEVNEGLSGHNNYLLRIAHHVCVADPGKERTGDASRSRGCRTTPRLVAGRRRCDANIACRRSQATS
jgi:hypothetical protein